MAQVIRKKIIPFIYRYSGILAITWTLVIFVLCATPGQYIPTASWLELLSFDKFVHASMFYILCSLLFLTVLKKKQTAWLFAIYFVICILYGAALEYMQAHYFSNRSSDWKDIVANSFGCVIALLLIKKLGVWFGNEKLT